MAIGRHGCSVEFPICSFEISECSIRHIDMNSRFCSNTGWIQLDVPPMNQIYVGTFQIATMRLWTLLHGMGYNGIWPNPKVQSLDQFQCFLTRTSASDNSRGVRLYKIFEGSFRKFRCIFGASNIGVAMAVFQISMSLQILQHLAFLQMLTLIIRTFYGDENVEMLVPSQI